MSDKLPLLVAYALVGLLIALWPLALRPRLAFSDIVPPQLRQPIGTAAVLGLIASLLLATVLPWWRHHGGPGLQLTGLEVALFLLVAAGVCTVLQGDAVGRDGGHIGSLKLAQTVTYVMLCAALSLSTLAFRAPDVLVEAWHHWGAYIGPSELLLAGARIFRDFPAQYGLGPTALIASTCGRDCWSGAYWIFALFSLSFALVLAAIALHVARPRGWTARGVVLLLCLASAYFWDASPAMLASPMVYPSINGMRFLPALLLVAFLIRADDGAAALPSWQGHAAWALAAAWSVESAFYATCIWWPYYLLLQSRAGGASLGGVLRSVRTLLMLLMAWVACFLLGYWLIYRTTPAWGGLFAYVLSPPGAESINYGGTVWFAIIVMVLGSAVNWGSFQRSGNSPSFRHGLVLTLLAYAAFSYYLGRSHDNNVLNLMPFLLLVLLHAWRRTSGFRHGLATGLLACLLAWFSVFNWDAWRAGARDDANTWFDPHWIRAALPPAAWGVNGAGDAGYSLETRLVMALAQVLVPGPVTVVGPYLNPSSTDSNALWSSFHGPANLYLFASSARREFLREGAATLGRSGWLLVQRTQPSMPALLADFDSAYLRTLEFDMAGYRAIHYAARKPFSGQLTP